MGFTQRHIDCCFPELERLAEQGVPKWMTDQLDKDFQAWAAQGPFTGHDMERMEAEYEAHGRGFDLCRFQVRTLARLRPRASPG